MYFGLKYYLKNSFTHTHTRIWLYRRVTNLNNQITNLKEWRLGIPHWVRCSDEFHENWRMWIPDVEFDLHMINMSDKWWKLELGIWKQKDSPDEMELKTDEVKWRGNKNVWETYNTRYTMAYCPSLITKDKHLFTQIECHKWAKAGWCTILFEVVNSLFHNSMLSKLMPEFI